MSVATYREHLTPEQMTRLDSLADLRHKRQAAAQARRQAAKDAGRPAPPIIVKHYAGAIVPMDTLKACDDIRRALEQLAAQGDVLDAAPPAKALLAVLLRLAWAKVSRKKLTNPEPELVPHKLFLRKAIDKPTMRRWNHVVRKSGSPADLLACCGELLVWLAADDEPPE